MAHPVSDIGSNAEENIAHAAKIIGKSAHRRAVFAAIYKGKKRAKRVSELIVATGLPHRRVLDAGKKLADNHIVKMIKLEGETAYGKIGFFQSHKRRVLALANSPGTLRAFPTKRTPSFRAVTIKVATNRAQVVSVTVDDFDSFCRVRRIGHRQGEIGDELSEAGFKAGLQRILSEVGRFQDWGGEVVDLFTSRIRFGGRRRSLAIALKGPGTRGKLTPGKMGKNGDQIQRLFEAPAEVFVVQYCRQIDLGVHALMKQLAMVKSLMTGARVYYGAIDGTDSKRLMLAYPEAFRTAQQSSRQGVRGIRSSLGVKRKG